MSRETNGIATLGDLLEIAGFPRSTYGPGLSQEAECKTKSVILSGFSYYQNTTQTNFPANYVMIAGNYTSNQLVKSSDISRIISATLYITTPNLFQRGGLGYVGGPPPAAINSISMLSGVTQKNAGWSVVNSSPSYSEIAVEWSSDAGGYQTYHFIESSTGPCAYLGIQLNATQMNTLDDGSDVTVTGVYKTLS